MQYAKVNVNLLLAISGNINNKRNKMATFKELTYLVLDKLKLNSNDSSFSEEHVLFMLNTYRTFLLKQRYSDIKKEMPESNYQTICIDLEQVNAINGIPCEGADYLKSVQEIPNLMQVGKQRITSVDFFQGNFTYVNNERFKYVGGNKYLRNQIYGTVAPDNHLYLKSDSPQMYYLEKVKMTGIFEDAAKASELECDNNECDVFDREFPLEESLVQPLVELIVKDLSTSLYQPADNENNDNDDLSKLANYISRNLRERRG